MKILEVRDGFIKFEADSEIYLSAFIQIRGSEKDYVAQVTQIKENSDNVVAYAKILFLLTDEGLQNYDRTLPSAESEIVEFTSDILCNSINVTEPIIAGKTLNKELNITIDNSAFNKKMLICTDSDKSNNLIVKNLAKQFKNLGKKVIIIDTVGVIDANKYVAGIDFKLPLNTDSLAFMYKDCLDDATSDSKSLIIDIFKDLSEYSKTVPFVPFETLRSIINDMVDSSHVFKLFVLKTKLNKLSKLGYFADNYNDVRKLDNILSNECSIFDLSKLDAPFQNQYLRHIYSTIKNSDTQVILELSNSITKQGIKSIYSNEQIATTFVANSGFRYINAIKNIFDNFIIEPSKNNNQIFEIYSSFLNSMSDSSYLIAGEATNYIPLVSALTAIDDMPLIEEHLSAANDGSAPNINTSEIIASIDEKSENAIEEVAENLKAPSKFNLFDDDSDSTEEQDNITEEFSSEESVSNTLEQGNDDLTEVSESIAEEADEVNIIEEQQSFGENSDKENILDELEHEEDDISVYENSEENTDIVEDDDETESSIEYETVVTQNISEEQEDIIEEKEVPIQEVSSQEEKEPPLQEEEVVPQEEEIMPPNEVEPDIEEEYLNTDIDENESSMDDETPITIENPIDIDFESDDNVLQEVNNEPSEESLPIAEQNDNKSDNEEDIIPVSDNDDSILEEIVELDANDVQEDDIIIDMGDSLNEMSDSDEEQIIKDVDKVFTTRKDDDITDTDLDFIDELNNEEIVLEDTEAGDLLDEGNDQDEIIQEEPVYQDEDEESISSEILEKRDASTPIVPVYDAEIPQEDMVISDPIQQGDSVLHAKYGSGVVEKMIKYGNKTLFAINFDNVGRRLLDPTLTEIKKS